VSCSAGVCVLTSCMTAIDPKRTRPSLVTSRPVMHNMQSVPITRIAVVGALLRRQSLRGNGAASRRDPARPSVD
jgi:hypothetical protein